MNWNKIVNPIYIYNNRDQILPNLRSISLRTVDSFSRWISRQGLPIRENERRLLALKNKHFGKRCFILGNGPSLKMEDLQKIYNNKDISIASNKIYLAFDKTDWRPDYYTLIDRVLINNSIDEIRQLPFLKILVDSSRKDFANDKNALFCRSGYEGEWDKADFIGVFKTSFSPDIIDKIYPGMTIVYWNLQIAYYMGFKEIYIIGLDFYFKTSNNIKIDKEYGEVLVGNETQNHFCKDYRPVGEKWTKPLLNEQKQAFQIGKDFLETHGVKVFNASRETKLDVFERVDFDSLF